MSIIRLFIGLLFCVPLWAMGSDVDWLLEDASKQPTITISINDVMAPGAMADAIELYRIGEYRQAVQMLESLRSLDLPDGRRDLILFALAESYRVLDMSRVANETYTNIVRNFPQSDKLAPTMYRLFENAFVRDDTLAIDSTYRHFKSRFSDHPLYSSTLYLYGLSQLKRQHYDRATAALLAIPRGSSRYMQAQFANALCQVHKKEYDQALLTLEFVRRQSADPALAAEALVTVADVYAIKGSKSVARQLYESVDRTAPRYNYARLKLVRFLLEEGQTGRARSIAGHDLKSSNDREYFFEMASLLDKIYEKVGKTGKARMIENLIQKKMSDARAMFDIYEELASVNSLGAAWDVVDLELIQAKNESGHREAISAIERIGQLRKELAALLKTYGFVTDQEESTQASDLAWQEYIGVVLRDAQITADSLQSVSAARRQVQAQSSANKPDSAKGARMLAQLSEQTSRLSSRLSSLYKEDSLVHALNLLQTAGKRQFEQKMQAKFVDWAFIKYQDEKKFLLELNRKENKALKKAGKDSLETRRLSVTDSIKLDTVMAKNLALERERLIGYIDAMMRAYPTGQWNGAILFRLAELYYDKAEESFSKRLAIYETKLANGLDTSNIEFPEFDLQPVIAAYDRIIRNFGSDDYADDACFYKAIALQKRGDYDSANAVLKELSVRYPSSEYYVEANMQMGNYYFEHPKLDNNAGYKMAEEAYRNVLYYRNHPQFVYALYQLGWCYYMQDQFEEAIGIFKYLIEEVQLDFDPAKSDEKQMVNPLLRGEAIDYIAISFDEENRLDDAVKFLKLVGNVDYAAMVLKRIGELREEDLDQPGAIRVYRRLLEEYPLSTSAPMTLAGLIKSFEMAGKPDSALTERRSFFVNFSKGSAWQTDVLKRDSALVNKVDSMAIANGLFVADAVYRKAETGKSSDQYQQAASAYDLVVTRYPNHPRATQALWNLAVILDTRLERQLEAYKKYLAFSIIIVADTGKREQAAKNAIAIAQKYMPSDSAIVEKVLDSAAARMVEAVTNYLTIFPGGAAHNTVLLAQASVYFNRKLYAKATETYQKIVNRGNQFAEYYEAIFMMGKCQFAQENYDLAARAFESVSKDSKDASKRSEAQKLLLQARFLMAKQLFDSQAFLKSATAYIAIEDAWPGSEYGDIVLFNAAQSFEKLEQWEQAAKSFMRLYTTYPASKYVADALFGAALDYEKINNYAKAAENYEIIVAGFKESDKAKDALFNLGLCYEKLGQMEKMADANERYSQKYPGEKDVEIMMMRSAMYYFNAKMYDKAMVAFTNYIKRFEGSAKAIESQYMIAKIFLLQAKTAEAVASFKLCEDMNLTAASNNREVNNYFAAEAAMALADMKHKEFAAIKFVLPESRFKADQKLKGELMVEAKKAYQRVIQYQGEKLFEAGYRIGQMADELALSWNDQERPKLDPIKAAVFDRDVKLAASALLQKSFVPYLKVIELSAGFDSLSEYQKSWVQKTRSDLSRNYLLSGQLMIDAIGAMAQAPIPDEIRKQPLYYYQYLKQLLTTLETAKKDARDYLFVARDDCIKAGLTDENAVKCLEEACRLTWMIPNDFDKLGETILKEPEMPKNISAADREDLLFQLEDIVFELQDKSILLYEDALSLLEKKNLKASPWYKKVLMALARLSPETYGKSFFQYITVNTGPNWIVRSDSVANWNTLAIPQSGWRLAVVDKQKPEAEMPPIGSPQYIWTPDTAAHRVWFWKYLYLNGTPRDAQIYYAATGKFRLFINGTLTASDTSDNRDPTRVDSLSGIAKLVRGGDNCIAFEAVQSRKGYEGLLLTFSVAIDTMQQFDSNIKLPDIIKNNGVAAQKREARIEQAEDAALDHWKASASVSASKDTVSAVSRKTEATPVQSKAYITQFKNRGEMLKAIADYQKRELAAVEQMKKERLEVQKLHIADDTITAALLRIDQEKKNIRKQVEGLQRKK